jgi:GNAT superfamily N-acetyltransferase
MLLLLSAGSLCVSRSQTTTSASLVMLAIRHRSDLSPIARRADILVAEETHPMVMAHIQQRSTADMRQRFADGHRAYVAWRNGEAAAWGWVATRQATIGELGATLHLPPRWRYLWNFVTAVEYRGQGIYPHLLAEMMECEADASTFLIAYAPENHASASGIRKAGFEPYADLSFDVDGKPAFRPIRADAVQFAPSVSLPVVDAPLTPCWKCVRAGRVAMSCSADTCRCDYQQKERECAV